MMFCFRSLAYVCLASLAFLSARASAEEIADIPVSTGEGFPGWKPLGEPGSMGWLTGMAVAPDNPRYLLLGGDMLGIGASTDRGDSWNPTFGLVSYEIGDITFHPRKSGVVWAGTMSGPHRSDDKGRTWKLKRNGFPPLSDHDYSSPVEVVRFAPGNPERLLAFGGSNRQWHSAGPKAWGAVWESTDGGERWTRLCTVTADGSTTEADAAGVNLVSADFAAGSAKRVYAASPGHGFYVSEDGGKSWKRRNQGLPHLTTDKMVVHPKDPDTVFLALNADPQKGADGKHAPGGVYRSDNAGRAWKRCGGATLPEVSSESPNHTSGVKGLAIARSNPKVLYTATSPWDHNVIYRSDDGGDAWTPVATRGGIGEDNSRNDALARAFIADTAYFAGLGMTHIVIDPRDEKIVYASNSEFVLRTLDGGKTWNDATAERVGEGGPETGRWRGRGYSGLCSMQFRFDPHRRGRAALNAMDAGKCWLSEDDLKSWRYHGMQPWPWGGGEDTSFAKDGSFYVSVGQHDHGAYILRVTPEGKTVVLGEKNGLPPPRGHEVHGIHCLPDAPEKVWACVKGVVYTSSDSGESWTPIPLPGGAYWLAGDPNRPERSYASGDQGVWRTEDGVTWHNLGGPRSAGRVTVDGKGRVLVAAWRTDRAGLWRYTPDDETWERLRDDWRLMNVATDLQHPERIAVISNDDPVHDVCRSRGVWFSDDDGASWFPANGGLPLLRGHAIAFDPFDSERVVCGTQGSGYYIARFPLEHKAPAAGRERYATTDADREYARPSAEPVVPAVRNPGMDGRGAKPDDWGDFWDDVETARDTKVYHSAPSSLRVTGKAGKSGQGFQMSDCRGGEKFVFSGWVKAEGNGKVGVSVQAFSGDWKQNFMAMADYIDGRTDWRAFRKEVVLPPWARRYVLTLRVEGAGTGWLDDVKVESEIRPPEPFVFGAPAAVAAEPGPATPSDASAPAAPVPATAPIVPGGWWLNVRNGDMRDGDAEPKHWSGHDGARIFRDTASFKSEPASLRVEGHGMGVQECSVKPGATFTLAGFFKRAGEGNGQVFAQFHNADWSREQFVQILFRQGDSDWTAFRKEMTAPDWADWVRVGVMLQGGRAWLDDVADAGAPPPEARPLDPRVDELPPGKPWEPGWCRWDFKASWIAAHEERVADSKRNANRIKAVFYGDSLTHGWSDQPREWKYFADRGAVNYGQGGDSTRQLLYRIPGEMKGLSPKVIVLAIGTNNLYGDANAGSDEEIERGVKACLDLLRGAAPKAKVVLVGICPRQNDYFMNRIQSINGRLKAMADGKEVFWFDLAPEFRQDPGEILKDGNLKKEYDSGDQLHLSPAGYAAYRAKLAPLFDRLMR